MNMHNRIIKGAAAMLLLAAGLSSCTKTAVNPFSEFKPEETYSYDIQAAEQTPSGSAVDSEFINASVNFSETLFRGAVEKEKGENLIISPLSVTYALSLTANGAMGKTLSEFNALNNNIPVSKMNEYLYSTSLRLSETKDSKVNTSNSIWTEKTTFSINEQFRKAAKNYYSAEVNAVEFSSDSAVNKINEWISKKTDGMIENAVTKLPENLAMLLINTVLFDGIWEEKYSESDILNLDFHNYSGSTKNIEFLQSTEYSCFESENGIGFSKAYKDDYRFIAIMPNDEADIYTYASSLDINNIIKAAESSINNGEECVCIIPKFEYSSELELKEILYNMGLETAFTKEAELSGLGKSDIGPLFISEILHQAKITLDEHGTKAAAATEVMVTTKGISYTKELLFDRPFFYMITDGTTGIPMFMGITSEFSD